MVTGTSAAASGTRYNPLYDPATDNLPIAPEIQRMLNQPLIDPSGFDSTDEAFLNDVIAQFEAGTVQRYVPSSLLKPDVYEHLDVSRQGKADQNAFNLLTTLRVLYDEWKANPVPTFQLKQKIREIRLLKESLEGDLGDVYVV